MIAETLMLWGAVLRAHGTPLTAPSLPAFLGEGERAVREAAGRGSILTMEDLRAEFGGCSRAFFYRHLRGIETTGDLRAWCDDRAGRRGVAIMIRVAIIAIASGPGSEMIPTALAFVEPIRRGLFSVRLIDRVDRDRRFPEVPIDVGRVPVSQKTVRWNLTLIMD